jgi:phosphoglycerol transferase MdoB-like AlkP superfamily enzyme
MSAIDDKILETLNSEDRKILDSYGKELGLFDLISESFRGKLKALVIAVFLLVLIFAVILIYCAFNFFEVEDLALKLNWLAVGLTALIVIGLLRLWYFMELNRQSVIREVKRLELQIALLVKRL